MFTKEVPLLCIKKKQKSLKYLKDKLIPNNRKVKNGNLLMNMHINSVWRTFQSDLAHMQAKTSGFLAAPQNSNDLPI